MSSSTSYDNLRRHARALETALDSKLTAYSKVASTISSTGLVSRNKDELSLQEEGEGIGGWRLAEEEVEELVGKLSETLDQLSEWLNDPAVTPSTSQLHAVQRHREVLADYRRDFTQTKNNIQHTLNSQNLLGSVRKDINAYKTARSSTADALLNERNTIDSSHRMTDDILEQAYATRSDFASQRTSLNGINSRMGSTLNTLPGMNTLLGLIQSKRRRDSIILGCVIGTLTVGFLI
ncbi:28 kda golgi snare protein [Phaffia rhodozyma]|uniref:Golgi SNAP receptor complex member 1 n=1 Tax=Phaffia rhodozyma TaxID=264483 RepID=A0A0F7SNR6_PHARH|nr:28 kda golgi snare protein [Phaffia rhodozyma]